MERWIDTMRLRLCEGRKKGSGRVPGGGARYKLKDMVMVVG